MQCIMDSDNIVYQKRKLRQFNLVSDIVISPKRSLIINKKKLKLKTVEITLFSAISKTFKCYNTVQSFVSK